MEKRENGTEMEKMNSQSPAGRLIRGHVGAEGRRWSERRGDHGGSPVPRPQKDTKFKHGDGVE